MARLLFAAIAVASFVGAAAALAAPKVTVNTSYYPISGRSTSDLIEQMRQRGPNGFWAYTRWYVRWTGDCRVSVSIDYTYPQWTDRDRAPPYTRRLWDKMMTARRRHEEGHGRHGLNAAAEVEKSRCAGDPRAITRKWAARDKAYDARTAHGRKEGVVLPR